MTDPVLPAITFRPMTEDEIVRLGQPTWSGYLAFDGARLVGFFLFTTERQYSFCDICTNNVFLR